MSSTRRTETPRQIHLDQGLLDRALTPPVAFDDRRLERLMAKLRYLQPHLASLGLQVALVVAGAGIASGRAALVTLGVAQPIRLRIQKCVQRLLHAAPHHPVEVVCTRECLALVADTSISGIRVARELDRLLAERGKPTRSPGTTSRPASRSRMPLSSRSSDACAMNCSTRPCSARLCTPAPCRLGWMSPAAYAVARRSAALRSTDGSAPRTAAITAQQGTADHQTPIAAG
jgi:hypothetical protein